MRILGISAFYHDSAAALVEDGRIVAAAQEERFTRRKHDAGFPACAAAYCLREAGVPLAQVDHVVFYEKPFLKFERLLETYLAFAPRGFRSFRTALPVWLREKLFQRALLGRELRRIDDAFDPSRLLFTEHHLSHAASAFLPSPFDEALILTMDGVGEWTTTSVALGAGADITLVKELHFPHSLGLLYSAFTYYTGFRVNSGEYKVMGLAPYGEPRFAQRILDTLIDLKPDGTFRMDQSYFDYATGLTMTTERFHALFDGPPRRPDEPLTVRHMDLAASVQAVTDEVVLRLTRALAAEYGQRNLCLAGGVALNCVTNGRVVRDSRFEQVWIQPAAGDAGAALGAALLAYYTMSGAARTPAPGADAMRGSLLGPCFTDEEILTALAGLGATVERASFDEVVRQTAAALAGGKAVGWFQGRMEFGPRALGSRSILADPRSPAMQSMLNQKIKFRESFRPFAPAVLREHARDWFDLDVESPYMMLVAAVAESKRRPMSPDEGARFEIEKLNVPRSSIPAVTHVDYSARVQTVDAARHERFDALLREFHRVTGCPILVNTSFNVRGEPIVCTPADAYRCFMETDLDLLVAGNVLVWKERQITKGRFAPRTFEPD